MRASRKVVRGKRSNAAFAPQPAAASGVMRFSTAFAYGSRVSAAPRSTSIVAALTSRAERNASYMPSPENGSTRPPASPITAVVPRASTFVARRIGSR
jgi:hypothetical protein